MRQKNTDSEPSQSQLLVIEALATGETITDAAAAGGVDRSTVHRWLRDDYAFQARLNAAKHAKVAHAQSRILSLLEKATETVGAALEQGDARTALAILEKSGVLQTAKNIGPQSELSIQNMRSLEDLL